MGNTPQLTEENVKIETLPFEIIPEESFVEGDDLRKSNKLRYSLTVRKRHSEEETCGIGGKEGETPAGRTTLGISTTHQFTHRIFVEDHDIDLNRLGFQSNISWCKRLDFKVLEDDDDIQESDTDDNLSSVRDECHLSIAPMKRDQNEDQESSSTVILQPSEKTAEISLSNRVSTNLIEQEQPFGMVGIQCDLATFLFSQERELFPTSTTDATFPVRKIDKKTPTWFHIESPNITSRIGSQDG